MHSRQGLHHGTTFLWPCPLFLNVVDIESGTIHRESAMCQAEYEVDGTVNDILTCTLNYDGCVNEGFQSN